MAALSFVGAGVAADIIFGRLSSTAAFGIVAMFPLALFAAIVGFSTLAFAERGWSHDDLARLTCRNTLRVLREAGHAVIGIQMPLLPPVHKVSIIPRGQSLGSATHWGMNALIAFGFPVVAQYTQALPFWLFAGAMLVQAVVIWRYFPETRGVTLETMESMVEGRG